MVKKCGRNYEMDIKEEQKQVNGFKKKGLQKERVLSLGWECEVSRGVFMLNIGQIAGTLGELGIFYR